MSCAGVQHLRSEFASAEHPDQKRRLSCSPVFKHLRGSKRRSELTLAHIEEDAAHLRRRLDEVARDARAVKPGELRLGAQAVERVAHLVEEGDDVIVLHERGPGWGGLGEVRDHWEREQQRTSVITSK